MHSTDRNRRVGGRQGRLPLGAAVIGLAVLLSQAPAGVAIAAGPIVSATFSGGAGTAVVGGTFYAKSAAALTLTVVTDLATSCVSLSGAHSASSSAPNASDASSRTWVFTMNAATGADAARATTVTSSNGAGCGSVDGTLSATYTVDNTAPALTATYSPLPNAAGWNNSDVTLTWTASDAGSGVATGPTPASATQTTETGGVAKTSTATDRVGNVRNASTTVKLDKTAPTVVGTRNPAANANGWNNTNVTVSFACTDTRSGVRTCSGPSSFTSNVVGQTVTGTGVDFAGNSGTTNVVVNVDKNAPTISGAPAGAPNAAGWYNADVTVVWTCTDTGGSGFAAGACADGTISTEGVGQTLTKSVTDLAGNASSTATSSPAVNVDKTPPTTTATPTTSAGGSSVTVALAATDGLSGVALTQFTVDGGPATAYDGTNSPAFTTQGNHVLEYWSVDNAGNAETHQAFSTTIDTVAPQVTTSQAPAPNANGWNNSDVTVSFSCSDAVSGVKSCPTPVTVSSEGANQSVSGTAFDNAGNSASATASASVDKTAPVVAVNGVAAGATYQEGGYSASCSTTDSLSGVASAARLSTTGGPTGSVTVTCDGATDRAGNSQAAPVSVTFTVRPKVAAYGFGGFQRPIGAGVNTVSPGQSVPVKFSVRGYRGMAILVGGMPTSAGYACGTAAPTAVTEAVALNGGLTYDATTDTYSLVWKTQKSWTGCRVLQLSFSDGSVARALFNFK